jgi:hypothetical protein
MFKLGAHNPLRREAKSVAVKLDRSLQVVDPEGNNGNPWFQMRTPVWASPVS